MSSTERLRKVRGTVRASVSRNITLLTGLLQDPDTEAREVNKQVTVLKSKEAELRQLDKKIMDIIVDEAVEKELEDAAEYHEKLLYAIADGQYFLSEREQSVHLRDVCYPPFAYARHDSGNYNEAGLCTIADDGGSISEGTERGMTSFEGSDSNHKSGLSASAQKDKSISIEVEGINTESVVMACRNMKPPSQDPTIEVSFGGGEAATTCVKDALLEQSLDSADPGQLLDYWTDVSEEIEHFGSILKSIVQPRKEEQPRANVEGGPVVNQTNGGSSAVKVKAESDEDSVSGQLRKRTNEEPADRLPTSNDGSFDLLGGEAGSPPAFPVASSSLDAQPGRQEFVPLNFEELDEVLTKQGDVRLEKEVKALRLPPEVKCSALLTAKRTRHRASHINRLVPREQKENQAQKLAYDVMSLSEGNPSMSASVSEFWMSQSSCHRNKDHRRGPSSSWRTQCHCATVTRGQENLNVEHTTSAVPGWKRRRWKRAHFHATSARYRPDQASV